MSYSINTEKYISKNISFCKKFGLNINLKSPKTIQDKLVWLNIYDTNPLKTKCADKILLRDYCKEILGENLCIPILKIYNSSNEINFNELPNQFVIKCNHGSGMNIIVKDKSKLDINKTKKQLDLWMKCDFAFKNGFEAHYHDIKHKIFIEEYKKDLSNGLVDYKFWCFNGEPGFIHVVNDRFSSKMHFNFYSVDGFKKMKLEQTNHPVSKEVIKAPSKLKEMVEYARKLSKPFKFVRVDFYEIDGKIYLGELTFTPDACVFKYKNKNDNIMVGNLLKI